MRNTYLPYDVICLLTTALDHEGELQWHGRWPTSFYCPDILNPARSDQFGKTSLLGLLPLTGFLMTRISPARGNLRTATSTFLRLYPRVPTTTQTNTLGDRFRDRARIRL
jgi:hypothetical protein